MKMLYRIVYALKFMILALVLAACEQQGPAENAGEKIDEAIENISDSAEEAADTVGDNVEEAGDKIEEQTDEVTY